ncbi:MAG: hypothetical protein NUW24_16655 [Anaerolineae bacterium]|jgi:hypothetical protein|nr:hypothetical protein [Anaerolineae bacterium]
MFTRSRKWRVLYYLLFLAVVLLGACTPQKEELPFETIEQADYSPKYETRESGLIIVASTDEASQLDGWISPEALEQLREVDYERFFAAVVFLSWQPTGHEGIRVERIVRQGNAVSIYALVGRPTGETRVSSPYHLVKIQKVGRWSTTINFALVIEETTVVSQSRYIP